MPNPESQSVMGAEKPLVLEEFGKQVNSSLPNATSSLQFDFYKLVYSLVESNQDAGGPLKGILFLEVWYLPLQCYVQCMYSVSAGSSIPH